ncbi:DUF2249 domain-containing protein [Bacillus sp. 3255]|uniref:DUF2249 domain-containing protein n=1 Tax=Bacillus sp. 3255 TaxID=2817904 RepID=UPI002863290F|nr:DUF2249 domain-containing protein [Bacillus sp. 3255]MDR6881311.1 hypothetical protein [Bacillus sp. 3255]
MDKKAKLVEVDVRPYLRKKLEPFKLIMDAVSSLKGDDIFILHATFKPTPLFGVMKVKGYVHKEEEINEQYWIVAFACGAESKSEFEGLVLRGLARAEEMGGLPDEQQNH